ncbi:paladin [Thraustotheca clavata]|uniref:phosphatidylinositol-3,5-bisphosphate 3-phosphatase n=1 Tax=Thraustotheca clavata TaxID=74557 RepID=A0A1V9ZYQ3_9STRA|nr:paladin [Thraustotheca clavata]
MRVWKLKDLFKLASPSENRQPETSPAAADESISNMTPMDKELVEKILLQAPDIAKAKDPKEALKALLAPLQAELVYMHDQVEASKQELVRFKSQSHWAIAATKIQAHIRGRIERGSIVRMNHFQAQGTKVLGKYILKSDRMPDQIALDSEHKNIAPNFRRLPGMPIYGSAQPSLDGIHYILQTIANDGYKRVIWANLREEAVLFVNGESFTARRNVNKNEQDLAGKITGHTVQVLEKSLRRSLQEQLEKEPNGTFEYWTEPSDLQYEMATEVGVLPTDVFTPSGIFDHKVNKPESIEYVKYLRLPISRENAPESEVFEMLTSLLYERSEDTALVFNCQLGRWRTTTAMAVSALAANKSKPEEVIAASAKKGHVSEDEEYSVIKELVTRIPHAELAKPFADATIDNCAFIYNIRSAITDCNQKSLTDPKPARRAFFLKQACAFLERYFFLIAYASFVLDHEANGEVKNSFTAWMQQHSNLFRLLDDMGGAKYDYDSVMKNAVVKYDHFPGIVRLPPSLSTAVINYRRVGESCVFGTAQCFEDGLRQVAEHLTQNLGFKSIIWMNMREEVVLYVAGRPYAIRYPPKFGENVELPGIEVNELAAIEARFRDETIAKVTQNNGLFLYWAQEVGIPDEEQMVYIRPQQDVKTLADVYAKLAKSLPVRYARIPVSDETAPEEKDLDDIVRLIAPTFAAESGHVDETAVVCNCQMGRGRTTSAMVCVYMLKVALSDSTSTYMAAAAEREKTCTTYAKSGNYFIIQSLLKVLDNGVESKALADYAIDQCSHLQNLRECIAQCRDLTKEQGIEPERQSFYMHRAVNYLERYFYLICFGAYILEQTTTMEPKSGKFNQLFVQWMVERYGSTLYALLDNVYFNEGDENGENDENTQLASMRWRWRRKRKMSVTAARARVLWQRNGTIFYCLVGLLMVYVFGAFLASTQSQALYRDIEAKSISADSRDMYPDKCRIENYDALKRMSIVYTWVNGSIPCYRESRKKFGGENAIGGSRDREIGELKYSIRSMQKFMPWHEGNIYIVTPGHIPNWVNLDHPRIKVVNQEDLFPEYAKSFLPSFNTHVIEQFLYRIPGLSDFFMQINDDYIFTSHVGPHEFFTCDGGIRLLHEPGLISHEPPTENKGIWVSSVLNTQQEMDLRWGQEDRYFIKHAPFIYSRRAFERIHQIFDRPMYMTLKSKFRSKPDMNIPLLHHYYMQAQGARELGIPIEAPPQEEMKGYQLIMLENKNIDTVRAIFEAIIAGTYDAKIIALNDEYNDMAVAANAQWFFETFLPEPSPFENKIPNNAASIYTPVTCEYDPTILPPLAQAVDSSTKFKVVVRHEVRWVVFLNSLLKGCGFGLGFLFIFLLYAILFDKQPKLKASPASFFIGTTRVGPRLNSHPTFSTIYTTHGHMLRGSLAVAYALVVFVVVLLLSCSEEPVAEVVGAWSELTEEGCPVEHLEQLRHSAIVYTWVNGNEPCYNTRRVKAGLPEGGTSRDKEIGELKYSIRSLLKFAPWLEGPIYIVSPGQIPDWLDMSNPRIKVIDQDDLMPKDTVTFPNFDTNVIEQYLYRIPGLTDIFIHMNDDYIFVKDVQPSHIFTCHGGGIRMLTEVNHIRHVPADGGNAWLASVRNTLQMTDEVYGGKHVYNFMKHAPFVYSRRAFEMIHKHPEFKPALDATAVNQMRSPKDLNVPLLHTVYMVEEGSKVLGIPYTMNPMSESNDVWLLVRLSDSADGRETMKTVFSRVLSGRGKEICLALNDEYSTKETADIVQYFYQELLPTPGPHELSKPSAILSNYRGYECVYDRNTIPFPEAPSFSKRWNTHHESFLPPLHYELSNFFTSTSSTIAVYTGLLCAIKIFGANFDWSIFPPFCLPIHFRNLDMNTIFASAPIRTACPRTQWICNSARSCCSQCGKGFRFYRRRHHCRVCGEIVCQKCSRTVYLVNTTSNVGRACTDCASPWNEQRTSDACNAVLLARIRSLPLKPWADDTCWNHDCTVCFEGFHHEELVTQLPCKHAFHAECLAPWLMTHQDCPLCRYALPKLLRPLTTPIPVI